GNYEILAQEFADKADMAQAEKYLFKALDVYTAATDVTGKARVIRSIARIQESQNKLKAATQNYKAAAATTTDKVFKTLNLNDYNRLKNIGNTRVEETYLNANILLLKRRHKTSEVADTYIQYAALNLKESDTINALQKYLYALEFATATPQKTIKIYSAVAKLYNLGKQQEEAITTIKKLLVIAENIKDYSTQITQLQYLATIYFKLNDTESAISALKKSYGIAATNGRTFEAKESLLLLTEYYKSISWKLTIA
ncbi:MAG: regulator of cell autolysis, partial [Bacteroidota bacterium]